MYDVLDVCKYVIKYSNDKDYGISNLKLQKLLYFIQAYFLIVTEDSTPCFYEDIEAWSFGPVVPIAYERYGRFGSCDIPREKFERIKTFNGDWIIMDVDYNIIKKVDKKKINEVIDGLRNFGATDLTYITTHQTPWEKSYKMNGSLRNVITIDLMKEYFVKK